MDVSNYFELCSNYVAGNVFVLKRWSSVSQDWPCFAGRTSQRSGKANEKLHAIKKKLGLLSAGPRPFTRTLEKPRWDMLNIVEQTRIGEVGCGSRQIEGQAWPD